MSSSTYKPFQNSRLETSIIRNCLEWQKKQQLYSNIIQSSFMLNMKQKIFNFASFVFVSQQKMHPNFLCCFLLSLTLWTFYLFERFIKLSIHRWVGFFLLLESHRIERFCNGLCSISIAFDWDSNAFFPSFHSRMNWNKQFILLRWIYIVTL